MPKLLFPQATFLLLVITGYTTSLPTSSTSPEPVDLKIYIPFLADMVKHYKSNGIVLTFYDTIKKFKTFTNTCLLVKRLSKLNVGYRMMNYSTIQKVFKRFRKLQVLLIVFVSSQDRYDGFRLATREYDMYYYRWLVIFTDPQFTKEDGVCQRPLGNPFNLVFSTSMAVKCHNDDRIRKWYSLRKNQTEVLYLSKWSEELGLYDLNKDYYDYRYDLHGNTIRIATNTRQVVKNNYKLCGLLLELVKELQPVMNFSLAPRVREDDRGIFWNNKTQRWSGLIGYLINHEVDLIVAPLTITKSRLDYVDFTVPILLSQSRIYVKQPDNAGILWNSYVKIFSFAVWFSDFLLFTAATFMTMYIRRVANKAGIARLSKNTNFTDNFMLLWGIHCNQGLPEFPALTSLRLVYVTILLLKQITWAVYSASITSYLTFLSPTLPFSDTEGFIKDGSFKLTVIQNSSDHDDIVSGDDPVLRKFKPLLKNLDELPSNTYSALLQVCDERVGFYTSEAAVEGVSAYIPCSLTYIQTGQFECIAMALRRKSPYTASINYNLLKLYNNGVSQKLAKWFFRELKDRPSTQIPINVYQVVPVLTVFVIGFALACLILLLENYLYHSNKKEIDNTRNT